MSNNNEMINLFESYGFKVETIVGVDFAPKKRASCDPLKPEVIKIHSSNTPLSEEVRNEIREAMKKDILVREDNFTNKVNIHENFQMVDIFKFENAPENWYPEPKIKSEEVISLISSIESIGLINPIVVTKGKNDDYWTIICGRARVSAFKMLAKFSDYTEYLTIPCFVLDKDTTSEYFLRSMMIDSLLTERKHVDKKFLYRAIYERHQILSRTDKYRKDKKSLTKQLMEEFDLSKTSVYNALTLNKLCLEAQALVWDNKLTNAAGLNLAKLNHETQLRIIETLGIEKLNDIRTLRILCSKNNIKEDDIKKVSERMNTYAPTDITFSIKVHKEYVGIFTDKIAEVNEIVVREKDDGKKRKTQKSRMNNFLRVKYDEHLMDIYLRAQTVSEISHKRMISRSLEELAKL